jgi:hypothetical protein
MFKVKVKTAEPRAFALLNKAVAALGQEILEVLRFDSQL